MNRQSGPIVHSRQLNQLVRTIGRLVAIVLSICFLRALCPASKRLPSVFPFPRQASSLSLRASVVVINNNTNKINNSYSKKTSYIDMASTTNDAKAKAAERKKQFLEVWPKLETELVDMMKKHAMPEDATEWFKRVRFLSSVFFSTEMDDLINPLELELQYAVWETQSWHLCR